jgi:TPR repeat protein
MWLALWVGCGDEPQVVSDDGLEHRREAERRCDDGDGPSCMLRGDLYKTPEDPQGCGGAAPYWYRRAMDAGHLQGRDALGVWEDSCPGGDAITARRLFQQACDGGIAVACRHLGQMLALGRGAEGGADPERARAAFQRACDGGDAPACEQPGVTRP